MLLRNLRIHSHALSAIVAAIVLSSLVTAAVTVQAQDAAPPQPQGAGAPKVFLPLAITDGASNAAGSVIPGQYIVVLKSAQARAAASPDGTVQPAAVFAQQAVETYGGTLLYTYDTAMEGFAAQLPSSAAAELQANPNVAYVEPDRVVTVFDTQSGPTWGLDRLDQNSLPLDNAYTYPSSKGAGVNAYIIDTGIRATHQEFTGRMGNSYTAVADGNGANDCNGHGTHVAGTVGGTTYGVAKGVTLHAVRVLDCSGSGSNSGVIAGINWVISNAVKPAVANMSLGGSASSTLDTAVNNAVAAGIVFAVAAGNSNADACNYSPARAASALTVGATTIVDARASYSNYGSCLDIFAPGSSILSSYNTSDSATATLSGTSMATPHVAGVAALYLAANPSATPSQVASALINNASVNKVSSAGTGSPNRLLYMGFLNASSSPTATPTPITPTATATPSTPTATPLPNTPTPTPLPNTSTPTPGACTNLVVNGGFEQPTSMAWTKTSAKGYQLICTTTSCGNISAAHSGSYQLWEGGANKETAEASQVINVPSGVKAYLSFWYRIASSDYCGYDYAYTRILSNGVTDTLKRFSLCSSANTSGWVQSSIDVSAYAGRQITLGFRTTTDSSLVSSFFVDDVALTTGTACRSTVKTADLVVEDGGDLLPSSAAKPMEPAGPTEFSR